jgi:Transglycosylase SLT domain
VAEGSGKLLTSSPFGPGPVPGFFAETFRVPPFLLPIYQSAAARYGVPWEVLAAINEVETDYGQDLSVSSAGAEGWMQFLPQTWYEYGVDATGSGMRDPYNPADAIFAAARYLRAANAAASLTGAIFAYNHSSIYVESVMLRARLLAGIPPSLLAALTALGDGRLSGSEDLQSDAASRDRSVGAHARLATAPGEASATGLTEAQWQALVNRLAAVPQPHVGLQPTPESLPDRAGGVDDPPAAKGPAPMFDLSASVTAGVAQSTGQESGGLNFLPQLGLPVESVNMVGAAADEPPGNGEPSGSIVWATGVVGSVPATVGGHEVKPKTTVLLRRSRGSGWQIVPVLDAQGAELAFTGTPGITADGGIVLLSSDTVKEQGAPPAKEETIQTLVTRDPGGAFAPATPPPPAGATGAVLEAGESLYPVGAGGAPLVAALDEANKQTGALIVPAGLSSTAPGVLHYDGGQWTRERICVSYQEGSPGVCTLPSSEFQVLAIAASSPQNAWLLASSSSESLMLFKRTVSGSGSTVWVQSQPLSWAPAGDQVFARTSGQMLSVTSQGVWIDAKLTNSSAHNADLSLLVNASSPSTLLGTWCYPQEACGGGSLGAPLPAEYRSFAWPGEGAGQLGTRIIVGLEDGALLRFQGSGDFQYTIGGGGDASSDAAFASPEEGWIAAAASAGSNSAQVEQVTTATAGRLQSWPLPFRRPLTAVASEPGTTPGDPNAQALAVGDQGQIARYMPGEGWQAEFLYKATGEVATPRLRAVAWPEPNRAYAVGDEGAMWIWREEADPPMGLWEPDPAEPLGFHANLTAIAFSPTNPAVGYAVGKQGTLLAYDKTWTQQALPPGLEAANFTSVAFAGGEALATYRMVDPEGRGETGGLIVNEGSGWHIETGAQQLLGELPATASVLSKVAGLPDGAVVAAGPGVVVERDSASSPWRFSRYPLPEAQNIAALAAIQVGSEVQALVSVDLDELSNPNASTRYILGIDNPPAPGFGEPAALIGPDPLPASGYLLRESPEGWEDLEQQAYPNVPSLVNTDLPNWPDAVLALDVDPENGQGWAVGGQTGGLVEKSQLPGAQLASQSAAALRLGPGPAPPQSAGAPIPTPSGQATFAVGGEAQCAGPCANFANEEPGPDSWLSGAVSRAAQIAGLHGFLYTGARVAEGASRSLSSEAFTRELDAYERDLQAAGSMPVDAAVSPSDVDPGGDLSSFAKTLGSDAPVGSTLPGTSPPPAGSAAYAFESAGSGGTVCVIVLDYSHSALPSGELGWLAEQLHAAHALGKPAIVMGNADPLEPSAPDYAHDASALERVLLEGGASAYLFDSPHENLSGQIGAGTNSIPVFGTGTLGYVPPPAFVEEFLGASGFLLVSVNVAQRNSATNRAPVSAALVPSISQLALDATDGTLLRRSQVALFEGLARRPAGGLELTGGLGPAAELTPDPYVPIPETCIGSHCGQFVAPGYTFTSSSPDFGAFVEHEPNNPNPRAVLQNAKGEPIPDEPRKVTENSHHEHELTADGQFEKNSKGEPINERGEPVNGSQGGVFCAFNAGTTTVSITTGGLTYSEPVTVQAGSVLQPCGTVPLINPPPATSRATAPVSPPPPSTPPASSPAPSVAPPPPPSPPAVVTAKPAPPARPAPPLPFFFQPVTAVPVLTAILPPPPVLARPIPPSGSAPVTVVSPAVAPKEESEDEEAVESARNNMAVYEPDDPNLPPALIPLALILLAAGAGASIRRSGGARRPRRAPALARARARRPDKIW